MAEEFFMLQLDDLAAPGFYSGRKPFIGSKQELLSVADRLTALNQYPETAKAIKEYFSGNHSAAHTVAFHTIPVLEKVDLIYSCRYSLPAKRWEHLNIWGCPYELRITEGEISQVLVRYEDSLMRCIRASLHNLSYLGLDNTWQLLRGTVWGQAAIMDVTFLSEEHFVMNNLLYVVEDTHSDEEEAIEMMNQPELIQLSSFCDEVFADG